MDVLVVKYTVFSMIILFDKLLLYILYIVELNGNK